MSCKGQEVSLGSFARRALALSLKTLHRLLDCFLVSLGRRGDPPEFFSVLTLVDVVDHFEGIVELSQIQVQHFVGREPEVHKLEAEFAEVRPLLLLVSFVYSCASSLGASSCSAEGETTANLLLILSIAFVRKGESWGAFAMTVSFTS